jgi:hypothetical protein
MPRVAEREGRRLGLHGKAGVRILMNPHTRCIVVFLGLE